MAAVDLRLLGADEPNQVQLPAGHALLLSLAAVKERTARCRVGQPGKLQLAVARRHTALALDAALPPSPAVRGKQHGAAAAAAAAPGRKQALHQFLAGGTAGAVSKTISAPLERASILLMAGGKSCSRGLGGVARLMWGDGGVRGLFRGNSAALAKVVPSSAVSFAVFNGIKRSLLRHKSLRNTGAPADTELSTAERLLAGAAAGASAATCTYPLDRMRTVMAVGGGQGGNLLQAAASQVAQHGAMSLYRGYLATLASDILGSALGFTLYDAGCRAYQDRLGRAPTPATRGAIGAASALCTLTATMPLEVVRRRLQLQGTLGRPVLYSGAVDCLRTILRTEGPAGFYAASLPLYLKVVPSIGCSYALYELLLSHMSLPAAGESADP